jgi:SAM-dependent methyltransferase
MTCRDKGAWEAVKDKGQEKVVSYNPKYSRQHCHFISQSPTWEPFLGQYYEASPRHYVLDLGSGGGHNSRFLGSRWPGAVLYAVDLSYLRCLACRQATQAHVSCADAQQLPFPDNTFAFVISTQVIEHVPNDRAFARELWRVLRAGGRALVSSVVRLRYGWYFYRNDRGEWMLDPTHAREYGSLEDYTAVFRSDFTVVAAQLDRFRFSPARFLYRSLIKLNYIRDPDPDFFGRGPVTRSMERITVPIPRYRLVTVILEKQ